MEEMQPGLSRLDIKSLAKPTDRTRKSNRQSLTDRERYATDVFRWFANLRRVFERIDHASHLMSRSPKTMASARHPLNVNDWTDYHFHAFTVSMHSVLDCSILLTSEVYRLGVPWRLCNVGNVLSNAHVAGTNAARALRGMQKSMETHRERRNRVLHRGEEADFGELTESSEWIANLRSFTFLQSQGEFLNLAAEVKTSWRYELQAVRPKLEEASRAAISDAKSLMTALEHPFTRIAEALGERREILWDARLKRTITAHGDERK